MGATMCVSANQGAKGSGANHATDEDGHAKLHGLAGIPDKVFEVDDHDLCKKEAYAAGKLSITVLGASGDLAKKKTYPSLMDLYHHNFLPHDVVIMGFARSAQTSAEFRAAIRPWLLKEKDAAVVDKFLTRCEYFKGSYDSPQDFARLDTTLKEHEGKAQGSSNITNRMFYFAIPPDAFLSSAKSIKSSAMCSGFNRLIVEKPFGHDLVSAKKLADDLGALFTEDHIYRIDHYLGKEIIQNLIMFRFGNRFMEPLWNNKHVESVRITFKEDFGTEGRGGYFTNYGIIRDIMQNHLMQVLSVMAMDEPTTMVDPKESGNAIRNAKVAVIKALEDIKPDDVVVGQYIGADGKPGYLEDDSIKDKKKAEMVPTFAAIVLYVNNERWKGVPFLIKAGKALDERKAEIRIQFKEAVGATTCYKGGPKFPRNELVMRLQPNEVIYMKAIVKSPGLSTLPLQTELDLTYKKRFKGAFMPEAYTRLILEALRGHQADFVRGDEIVSSWIKFDPMLKALEDSGKKPLPYKYGGRGPEAADKMFGTKGFCYSGGYDWKESK